MHIINIPFTLELQTSRNVYPSLIERSRASRPKEACFVEEEMEGFVSFIRFHQITRVSRLE